MWVGRVLHGLDDSLWARRLFLDLFLTVSYYIYLHCLTNTWPSLSNTHELTTIRILSFTPFNHHRIPTRYPHTDKGTTSTSYRQYNTFHPDLRTRAMRT